MAAINPLSTSKQTLELKGVKARVQSHRAVPEIFANVDLDDPSQPATASESKDTDQSPERFRIVKVQPKNGNRIVGDLKIYVIGKVKQEGNWIATKATPVSG